MAETPLPNVTNFYLDGEPHMAPGAMVDILCETRGITKNQLGVKPVTVLTFFPELVRAFAERTGATKGEYDLPGGRMVYVIDDAISLVNTSIGAPATIAAAEELYACGTRDLLVVGAAGSLQHDLPIGSVTLPTTAIREEGTSHHYLPHDIPAVVTPRLLDALRGAWKGEATPREGLHWTTDAPYREHHQKIAAYREAGVLSVDMEVSALYAFAQHRGVGCAAILAISDELYEPWRFGFTAPEFLNSILACADAAVEAARVLVAQAKEPA